MVAFFDTSALVAALISEYPRHAWAYSRWTGSVTPALAAHSLAELYAVLTASPQFRLRPDTALETVRLVKERFQVVALTSQGYLAALERAARSRLQGGAVYDVLIAQAALESQAERLLTLNAKHFVRLGEDMAQLVEGPPA